MPKLQIPLNDIPASLDMLADVVGNLVDANNAIADRVTALEGKAPAAPDTSLADRVTALEKAPAPGTGGMSSTLSDKVTAVVEKYFSHEFAGDLSAPTEGRKIAGYNPQTGAPIYADGQTPTGGTLTGYDPVTGQLVYAVPGA